MKSFLKKDEKSALAILIGLLFLGILIIGVILVKLLVQKPLSEVSPSKTPFPSFSQVEGIKKFTSKEEFQNYLKEGNEKRELTQYLGWEYVQYLDGALRAAPKFQLPLAKRVSETTVQVPGIDEPDLVKTDGKEIYFSPREISPIWRWPIIFEEKIVSPYPQKTPKTKIVKAFPPSELSLDSEIEKSGDLLLVKEKNILVIFSENAILGYDVANPQQPQKKWEIKLEEANSIVTSRLYKNKIYLVTQNLIDEANPCPIKPFILEGKDFEIDCQQIYHPLVPIPVDVTFLAMVLDPISGEIEKQIPFVGSFGQSVVYMSNNALYITYSYSESKFEFFLNFLKEEIDDLFPDEVREKIKKLEGYDISQQAKMTELLTILRKYLNSLSDEEQVRLVNELEYQMSSYYQRKKRELEKSGILKIDLEEFQISATAHIPGRPLNQFALDEYQENLRIAVTLGNTFFWFGYFQLTSESANDVYILDKNLKILGSVQDLGLTEEIYSVRFIEDKGYVVTFRETDPFYVLDLSDPKNPKLKGELKIPGYSSYLHPIEKDKILGIGKEGWKVKISLFDVSNPENPKELDKYMLNESWSDVLKTHHAFLLDQKHEIFFLPGRRGGYIFSYKDDKLKLIKAVGQISAKRAIYLDDYLYIIANEKIVVLDERSWEKINELIFD